MISTPSELYPGNNDLENLPLQFTPPPTSFLAQFEQLSTYTKYVENKIQSQESEIINTLKPISTIIKQLELVAFDLAVFLDNSHRGQIHEFFERCFSMENGKYSFSLTNPKSVLNHVKYLLSLIASMNLYLKSQPFYKSNMCIGDTSDTQFEEQLKHYLRESMQFFSDVASRANRNPSKGLALNCNFKVKVETDSKEFAKFLLSLYKVPPSIKITKLANRLAFRLTTIFDLQESITKMRELCSIQDTAKDNELYDIDSIKQSEQYKLLNQRCHFLSVFMKHVKLDQLSEIAYQLTCDLTKQGIEFDKNQQQQHEVMFSEIQNYEQWLNDNEIAVQQLNQKLTPLAKQFFSIFNESLPSKEPSYNTFAFPKAISICKSRLSNDAEKLKKVDQIYNLYTEISKIYDDCLHSAYRIRDLEFDIIDINSKIMYQDGSNEIIDLKKKADGLADQISYFLRSIKPQNIQSKDLIIRLKKSADVIQKIESDIFKSIELFNRSLKSEAQQLPLSTSLNKQRDELLRKIREADRKLIETKKVLYDINEKKAAHGKWSEMKNDTICPNVNGIYQSNFTQMENMMMCKACKSNYRNVLIEECGHVVCPACFEDAIAKEPCLCPQCRQPFDMNEFIVLEKRKILGNAPTSKESGA